MSNLNKTRLELQKILRDSILEGLTKLGYQNDTVKWDSMEYGQASFSKADKIVTFEFRRVNRIGWQGRTYIANTNIRKEDWLEEQSWQLQVILKRPKVVTITDIVAEDVAAGLITWFNGPAAEGLRNSGISPVRIDADNVIVYNDDSSVYQKRAVFTMKLQVPKEYSFGENFLADVVPETYPI